MRRLLAVGVTLVLALAAGPARAQEAEALKKELEEMRTRFERMQQDYERTMSELAERIRKLEQQPSAPSAPTAGATQAPPPPPAARQPGLVDLAQPRAPYSLYERPGSGQFLFDMGIVSDFVGTFTQRNVERAQGGTFAGRENRFFPREVEVNLFGRIDPYAEGHLRFEFAEEFEDGERVLETKLAEAYFTLLTLPFGTRVTIGQLGVPFGLLSSLHREALPQPDTPQVLLRFLGEEQFREAGALLTWVAPTPFFLETSVGVFNGDNETAFGRGSLRSPLLFGRARTFFELGDSHAIQLGLSGARGRTGDDLPSDLIGFDAKYKLTPDGWRHPLLTIGGEAIFSSRKTLVSGDPDEDGIENVEARRRDRFGWYTWAEVQPSRRWAVGLRYDSTQFPVDAGREWAIEPYVGFLLSDFFRLRLAYKHTERSTREPFNLNDSSARTVDELLFQATFFLGAHRPHPF